MSKKKRDDIDAKQLEICKQRGHDDRHLSSSWWKCKWCGMWLREVRTIEERRTPPPVDEQSPLLRLTEGAGKKSEAEKR